MRFPKLFEPLAIGSLTVPNRICFAASSSELADERGFATKAMAEYYGTRARGGVGLIVVEATYVEMEGRRLPNNAMLHDDRYISGLARVAEAIHAAGGSCALQLNHGGREAVQAVSGSVPLGPSPIASTFTGGGAVSPPRELTVAEIARIVRRFGEAAVRARQAGFDAVEIHGAHGYLVSQFLSPASNRREDGYGREQVGRARFVCEIVREIHRRIGDDVPVLLRMNSSDHIAGGTDLDLACVTARAVEAAGVAALSISGGVHASRPYMIVPGMMTEAGWNRAAVARIRREVGIPVMIAGRITSPDVAEELVATGAADMVCLSRALIADPDFAAKARADVPEQITPCIACNECVASLYRHEGLTCTVNPVVTKELPLRSLLRARPTPRKITIIGGGAAGLSAAITAARRGHEVTIFEEATELGGQLDIAHKPPQREAIGDLLIHYRGEVARLRIATRLGRSPTADDVRATSPDVVLVAIGARSQLPPIPGIDLPLVKVGWRLLSGDDSAEGACAVLGGGLVGVEVADHLAVHGHQVVLIARSTILKKAVHVDDVHYRRKLASAGVEILEHCAIDEIGPDWVRLRPDQGLPRTLHGLGTVVACLGYTDRLDDAAQWANVAPDVRHLGDVKGSAKFVDAIREGTMTALEIS